MQRIIQKRICTAMLVLLFATYMFAMIPVPCLAVVGSLTATPTKAIYGVETRIYMSGSGWTPGAPFWYQIQTDTTWRGEGTETRWAATAAGAIPEGAYITFDETATKYILLSQSKDGTAGVAWVKITVVPTGPVFDGTYIYAYPFGLSLDTNLQYGYPIYIFGSGFTEGGSVTIYWNLEVLGTVTAASDGTIDTSVTVPEAKFGLHTLWVYDAGQGVASGFQGISTTDSAYKQVNVIQYVEADRLSIRGTAGESFVLRGYGFAREELIAANSITVDSTSTLHAAVTTTTKGSFSVTVALAASLPAGVYGFYDITVTGSVTGSYTESDAILRSTPAIIGDEDMYKSPTSGAAKFGTFYVWVWNFPASTSVSVTLGSIALDSITTDANGAGYKKQTVPETFGGTYLLSASSAGLYVSSSFTVTSTMRLYDKAGKRIYGFTNVPMGEEIRLIATGLAARGIYTITEEGYNIVQEDQVTKLEKGSFYSNFQVRATTTGTIELWYTTGELYLATDDDVDVAISGPSPVPTSISYDAIGVHSMAVSPSMAVVGVTPTISLSGFVNLIPDRRYQILFDGAVQTVYVSGIAVTHFLGANPPTHFIAPSAAAGVHNIDLVFFGAKEPTWYQARVKFIFSSPGTTATIMLSHTARRWGQTLRCYGYNFDARESVTIKIPGTAVSVSVTMGSEGAFDVSLGSDWNYPEGDYLVYAERTPATKTRPTATFTIKPAAWIASSSATPGGIPMGQPGEPVAITLRSLLPNTRYVLLWDTDPATATGGTFFYVRFTTDSSGYADAIFTIPASSEGDHYVGVALESDFTKVEKLARWAYIKVYHGLALYPNPEAITGQLVQFEFVEPGLTPPIMGMVLVDNYPLMGFSFLGYDDITGVVSGTFTMPNGDPETWLLVQIVYSDSAGTGGASGFGAIKRVSGAGSLLIGVDLASDIAYIKGKVSDIAVSLSELNAKVVAINGTLATIETKLGTMYAKLDDIGATLESISEGVATIDSTLGEIKASLSAIDLSALDVKITSINNTVVKISSAIGNVTTSLEAINAKVVAINGTVATIKTDVGTISGKVTSIDGNVATIKTDVGTIKADVSNIKGQFPVAVDMTPIWIAVVLSLIAAIAAIAAVVQISRKIAG